MNKVFGIVGWSGSGKTHLICRLIKALKKRNITCASVKHSHHNFEIDKEGKDSFNHLKSGSNEVVIFNENKFAIISSFQKKKILLDEILQKLSKKNEIILIEGLKNEKIPKIEVTRSSIRKPFIHLNDKYIKGVVLNDENDMLTTKLPKFKFKDTEKICMFILKYLKKC